MHTIMVIAGGFALLAICLLVGWLTGNLRTAALAFFPLWLVGAALNMWIGVNRAGYTYAQEFPIFLLVFGVPAIVALISWWRAG